MQHAGSGTRAHAEDIEVRAVPFEAPWRWLEAGWRDMTRAPQISLAYGLAFVAALAAISLGLYRLGWLALAPALAGGLLMLGPFVAVGLYDTSRRLESGEPVSLGLALSAWRRSRGRIAFLGFVLFLFCHAWLNLAMLLFMLFFGGEALPNAAEFLPALIYSRHGLMLLVFGTAVGAVLAAIVFVFSVVSIPLHVVRDVDIVTAARTSLGAVQASPKAMALWAVLIVAMMAAGAATLGLGLIVAFPLVGHASWHAFRDVVRLPELKP